MEEEVKQLGCLDLKKGAHFEVLTLGNPRDPSDFIKDAHAIGHPRRAFARVPALMKEVLEEVFLSSPFEIKAKRANFLKKWMRRAGPAQSRRAATPCQSPGAPSTFAQRQKATVVERDSAGP